MGCWGWSEVKDGKGWGSNSILLPVYRNHTTIKGVRDGVKGVEGRWVLTKFYLDTNLIVFRTRLVVSTVSTNTADEYKGRGVPNPKTLEVGGQNQEVVRTVNPPSTGRRRSCLLGPVDCEIFIGSGSRRPPF